MSKKTEVAVKAETGVAALTPVQVAIQQAMADNSASGFEEAGSGSYAVPFISILQALSPQCKKKDSSYIEGAEEGMFFNSVSGEVLDGDAGIEVIPCYYAQRYLAWGLREEGGGFKGEFMPSDPVVHQTTRDDKGRDIINGRPKEQLVDTRVHYCLLKDKDGSWQPAVLSFSSTQVKKSKQWMSRMQQLRVINANGTPVQAPMFSRIWHITSVSEGNEKGTWMGYQIGSASEITDTETLYAAMTLNEQVKDGMARASYQDPNVENKPKGEEENFEQM